jgi:hypothetical protein
MVATRQISLQKGARRYVFRYAAGQEAKIIDALASMASSQDNSFDWFDASVLSYQIGRNFKVPCCQGVDYHKMIPARAV